MKYSIVVNENESEMFEFMFQTKRNACASKTFYTRNGINSKIRLLLFCYGKSISHRPNTAYFQFVPDYETMSPLQLHLHRIYPLSVLHGIVGNIYFGFANIWFWFLQFGLVVTKYVHGKRYFLQLFGLAYGIFLVMSHSCCNIFRVWMWHIKSTNGMCFFFELA